MITNDNENWHYLAVRSFSRLLRESYEKQKGCYICEKEFSTDKKYRKVRDHCHYTGKFRGATHNIAI